MRGHGSLHSLVVQARVLGRRRGGALRPRRKTLETPMVRLFNNRVGTVLVSRVVQQSANIVHEERIQQIGDLLLVSKLQSALEWDPRDQISSRKISNIV